MTLPRSCLLALMMACSMPALAQDRAPTEPIVLGTSYQGVETFCRDRTDALEVAAAIENALAQPQAELVRPPAMSCQEGRMSGVYVSKEFTYRLIPIAMNVAIYIVNDAQVNGVSAGKVYVIAAQPPAGKH